MTNQLDAIRQVSHAHIQACKSAADPVDSTVQSFVNQALKHQAVRTAGMSGLAGLGVGAGVRGAAGVANLVSRNIGDKKKKKPLRHAGLVEIPASDGDEKEAGFGSFVRGDHATTVGGVPWAVPAAAAAGGAGLAGGWKLVDYLMNKRRQSEVDEELSSAKEEYMHALRENTAPSKLAGDNSLGRKLDLLYSLTHKTAGTLADVAGQAAGGYGLYAGATGLAAGAAAYQYGKKRQDRTVLEKALKKHKRESAKLQPLPIYVSSKPRANKAESDSEAK